MPRPRTVPDEALLDAALGIVHRDGPAALTFGALASDVGLAGSTLVQRFGNKTELLRAALLRAWDVLDEVTADLIARAASGPDGVVELLVSLTASTPEDDYAEHLPVLREDLRDPVLRARGAAWIAALADAIDRRLDEAPSGTGRLVVAWWQGQLTVWGFDRAGRLDVSVRAGLADLLGRLGWSTSSSRRRDR